MSSSLQFFDNSQIKDFISNTILSFAILSLWILTDKLLRKYLPHPPILIEKMNLAIDEKEREFLKNDYFRNILSLINGIIMFTSTSLYVMNNDQILNTKSIPQNQKLILIFNLNYFIMDSYTMILNSKERTHLPHHIILIIVELWIVFNERHSSELFWFLWIGECTAPVSSQMYVIPYHTSSESINLSIKVIFAILFIYLRIVGQEWLIFSVFNVGVSNSLFVELCATVIWFMSLKWCYEIINMFFKTFAALEIPGNIVFKKIYQVLKIMRKYNFLTNIIFGFYTFRYFLVNIGITDVFVRQFGKCNYEFLGTKTYKMQD